MDREVIIARLKENEAALRAHGVAHAALFGSRARGDNRPDSDIDIDIMVELLPEARVALRGYVGIVQAIKEMFAERVDLSNRDAHLTSGHTPNERPSMLSSTGGRLHR